MQLGLKLWSTNTDYYLEEAKRLYQDNVFDYIELYVVPNTLENIVKWKELLNLSIRFALHAPHFMHEINLADKEKFDYNKVIFEEVEEYRQVLQAEYTVVHCGMNYSIEESARQLKLIKPVNALIENKPYYAPLKANLSCRGSTFEEVSYILKETGYNFCLDIGHAICTANSLSKDPYSYLAKFQTLSPKAYHLSDNQINASDDKHLNIGKGNYDFKKIFEIISRDIDIAIETKKKSNIDLNDFVEDIKCLKTYI